MKRGLIIFGMVLFAFALMNFTRPAGKTTTTTPSQASSFQIPDDVNQIIQNSCYGCHNSDSKNLKGKMKLKFDELDALSTFKAVGKLTKIAHEVEEAKMPPARFLKNYPDKALSDKDKQRLISWATDTAKSLSNE